MSNSVHSHTAATALAGAASKVAVDAAAPSPSGTRPARARRSWSLRVVAVFAVMAALVGVGAAPSAFAASSDAANRPVPSAVRPTSGPPRVSISTPPARHRRAPRRQRLLARLERRRRLQLRRRPVLRLDREPPPEGSGHRHGGRARRQRLLADRHRRWRVHLRRRRVPRLARQPAAQLAHPLDHGDTVRQRLLARGGRRWRVRLRRRRVPRCLRPASRNAPIVGMASTPSGHGYYAARLRRWHRSPSATPRSAGAAVDAIGPPATAIAASPDGAGYWVLRQNGIVHPFAVPAIGDIAGSQNPAVGIAARANGGYWIAEGKQPPPPAAAASGPSNLGQHPFLACTRAHESDSRRWLPRGERERHVPRCVPVLAARRGTTPRATRAAPTSSVSTRPRPRRATRTSSRSTCTSGRVRRRGAAAAPASRRPSDECCVAPGVPSGCRMPPKLHLPCADGVA